MRWRASRTPPRRPPTTPEAPDDPLAVATNRTVDIDSISLHPAERDGNAGAVGYLRQEYLAWRSGQLSNLTAVGAAMRTMAEVTDDNVRSGQAAGRGERWPHEQLLDLARRRVAAYAKAVDYGIDAVADQQRAEQELRELEAANGSARP